MDLIFFGMQGAGKGTLGRAVAEKFNLEIFDTGKELRRLSSEDSPLGLKIKSILEAGNLVDNDVVMEIVEDFINNLPEGKGILFDGVPRSTVQGKDLNHLLESRNRNFKGVLIEISKETAFTRLTTRRLCENCKTIYPESYKGSVCEKCDGNLIVRSDDTPEAIAKRIENFEEHTIPTINLYSNLLVIDGEPEISEVEKTAISQLEPFFQ